MTNVLEMMKQDINSVVGLCVAYDYGSSKPLVGVVQDVRKTTFNVVVDGEKSTIDSYSISFNGLSFYVVDAFTRVLDFGLIFGGA